MQNSALCGERCFFTTDPNHQIQRLNTGVAGAENWPAIEYYFQRASAELIVTECTQISDRGHGIIRAPGLHRQDQVDGWRPIVDAIHAVNGRIYCQLWHCGCVSHPDIMGGALPVAPSAVAAQGSFYLPSGLTSFPVPHVLGTEEIAGIVRDFGKAAEGAKAAGFDGVELHGAFGYLPDQFLQHGTNQRSDAYGGSVPNRARFMHSASWHHPP